MKDPSSLFRFTFEQLKQLQKVKFQWKSNSPLGPRDTDETLPPTLRYLANWELVNGDGENMNVKIIDDHFIT